MARSADPNGFTSSTAKTNGETSRFKSQASGTASPEHDTYSNADDERRPSSAPGRKNDHVVNETQDDFAHPPLKRPTKPQLLRSKSDFTSRLVEESEEGDPEVTEWGARHGFDDHYQSEHIISQLANVSCFFHLVPFFHRGTQAVCMAW